MEFWRHVLLPLIGSFLLVTYAFADLSPMTGAEVAPNIAEINVSDSGVQVLLEIYVDDLPVFEDLLPDDWVPGGSQNRASHGERMQRFSRQGLSIRPENGGILPLDVVLIEPRERINRNSPLAGKTDAITGFRYPTPPDDPRVIYAELFYSFEGTSPERLIIAPPQDEDGNVRASIGMIVFDRKVAVTDFRHLSTPAYLTLDWQDPWYSRFENPKLRRHHRDPVMTFLYAEPYEIRHEALLRVGDAARLANIDLDGPVVSDAERQSLKQALPNVLRDLSPMTVNGEAVVPDFDRMSFLKASASGLTYLEPGEDILTDVAIVGLIYSVPTDSFAKEATVKWSVFDEAYPTVPGNAIDTGGPFFASLTPENPVLTWTNYFKKSPYPAIEEIVVRQKASAVRWTILLVIAAIALVSIACLLLVFRSTSGRRAAFAVLAIGLACAAAIPLAQRQASIATLQLTQEAMTKLSDDLLTNVYRAFDFRTEDQVYDRLALTLAGDVLEKVYLEQRRALRVKKAGGAQARVDRLEVTSVTQLPEDVSGTLRLAVAWRISGTVGHWGHNHRRANAYTAEVTLQPANGVWKIQEFDVLSQDRQL
ncbi:hypothetical protein [uncultured Shimia sp.]|uniref:hypothetical protein n=1 Tax=uncultured Shimia sp. TaxID=573152 RepID=UPI002610B082|nr:hypothetical protein [uncultured Shimia sp.]